jgi:molybdopterin synthase sulfur carrier subunit
VPTVLLFAQAREAAGTREVELEGTTVMEVLAAADERFGPEFARLRTSCSVAVDGEVVAAEAWDRTPAGAEVAVLPPVSGGAGAGAAR